MPRKLSPDKLVQRLLQSAPMPVYLLDPSGEIAFVNAACAAWLGESEDSLLGRKCPYESAAEPSADTLPGLAPPAEAFAKGTTLGYVASPTDGGKVRACHFHALPTSADEGTHLLAIVSGESQSAVDQTATNGAVPDTRLLHAQLLELRSTWKKHYRSANFLGVSPAAERIRAQIRLAAAGARRVLVVGPVGSGREFVARAVHHSQPTPGPLIPIACRLLDAETMQRTLASFLKQHQGERAVGAAILLQDVDQLSPTAQQELSEFLRLPGVELTLRATSRRSLRRLAAQGRFRADLAHALSTLTISVPALKNRSEDIPLLAQHFVEQANARSERKFSGFAVDALDELAAYRWPGNVAELQRVVQQCCERAAGPYITPADLPDALRHDRFAAAHPPRVTEKIDLDKFLAEIEREALERAMAAAGGNKTKAASLLGIHRARLIRRLVQLGLVEPSVARERVEAEEEVVIFEPHPDET